MNSPVRLGVSPAISTPKGFMSQRLWSFISLHWNLRLHSLSHSPVVLPHLCALKCGTTCSTSCCLDHRAPQSATSLGLPAATLLQVLSNLAAHLHPSYQSRWMFLLYLLGCWTSIEFDFLSVLVVFCFSIVVVLLLVVRGSSVYLPIPPSWFLPPCFLAFNFPFSFQLSSTLDRCVWK